MELAKIKVTEITILKSAGTWLQSLPLHPNVQDASCSFSSTVLSPATAASAGAADQQERHRVGGVIARSQEKKP